MKEEIGNNKGEIIIYQSEDGKIKLDVRLEEKTVWLTQEQIAQLYGKGRSTITEHISNIFKEGELEREKVCIPTYHSTWCCRREDTESRRDTQEHSGTDTCRKRYDGRGKMSDNDNSKSQQCGWDFHISL